MKPTDESIRKNIIIAIQRKEKRRTISKWLNISVSTVDRIWKRYTETNSYLATPYTGRKSKINKEQELEIRDEIKKNPGITLDEMIEKLLLPLTTSGLFRKLKKMGYSYKKRHYILKDKTTPMCKKNVKSGS